MANKKNKEFFESLKVQSVEQQSTTREEPYSDSDVYTCLKLMQYTNKIINFLASAREQKVEGLKLSKGTAMNYFYNIAYKLSHAELDFRKGTIDGDTFNKRIDEACKSSKLDFNYLMELVNQIDSLEKKPNKEESIKLAQSIEDKAVQENEKRLSEEKEI